ncbi:hypothetical protein OAU27_00660 [bacterium]|nr:hypothetical protein [bacterium]
MREKKTNNEINLLEILLAIKMNKAKFILIVALTMAVTFGLQINEANKTKKSKFITTFKAISMIEENQYQNFNVVIKEFPRLENTIFLQSNKEYDQRNVINRYFLFDLFQSILKDEVKKFVKAFNFIKREDYENDEAYEIVIDKIVSSISLSQKKNKPTEGIIEFFPYDENTKNKWTDFINSLENSINASLKNYLSEIIDKTIENAKFSQKNKIEDVERQIENTLKSYDLEISNWLSFLEEQAKIARAGNIEIGDAKIISDIKSGGAYPDITSGGAYPDITSGGAYPSIYFLKGFKVIEKEIALIKERKDPRLFLQKIPSLESRKIELENDQTIIRVQAEYEKTPIFNGNKFSAGSFMVGRSKFEIDDISIPKMITISILIALMTGVFYLLIANVFHNKGIVIKRNRR